jgi:hypothetical protein
LSQTDGVAIQNVISFSYSLLCANTNVKCHIISVITLDAAAKLLRMNLVDELRKNCFSSVHSSSLAQPVLGK